MPFFDDLTRYEALVSRADAIDLYHLPTYQLLEAARLGGRFVFFEGRAGDEILVMPLIERAVPEAVRTVLASVENDDGPVLDLTMAYGFPSAFLVGGTDARDDDFCDAARAAGYLTSFVREHPVFGAVPRTGIAFEEVGTSVSVSLVGSTEQRRASYRKVHRRDIGKASSLGVSVRDVALDDVAVERFGRLYESTMCRVGATSQYFFDAAWIRELDSLGVRLVEALVDGEVIAASLFSFMRPCAQYLLSGSSAHTLRGHGSKTVIDTAAEMASDAGCESLHLGGGLGGQRDGLHAFKAGFGRVEHAVRTAKVVFDARRLETIMARIDAPRTERFPPYRP